MPPRRYSRFSFSAAVQDDAGRIFLTECEPFRFRPLPDTRQHVVQEGDTLFSLAGRYFAPLPRPSRPLVGHRRLPARNPRPP